MKFFGRGKDVATDIAVGPPSDSDNATEKHLPPAVNADALERVPSQNVQDGVKKIEAVTLTWTRNQLIMAYGCIFLVFFVISMQQQIQFNVSYYVTSSFALLPLTGTTSIVAAIVGGVIKLPTAKFVDLVGRAEGFAIMTGFATLGLVMMASCRDVETYAAAQVFYWVGFNGMAYVLDVFMADTSSLKNRALVFSFATTPYIVTTFIGPRAAQSFLETSGWPWAYGTFAIITPIITLPLLFILYQNQREGLKEGLLVKERSGRSFWQSVNFHFWEFDVIGLLLVSAGFVLFLLPFSLETYQSKGWGSGMIITMLVIGILCLIAFVFYEKFLSRRSFIPFYLLKTPSVVGACLLAMFLFISFYIWDSTFYNYLQAVHGLSITNTGYVTNIYSIGSCFWSVILPLIIRTLGRFKWLAISMLCLEILGVGLMIHFRQPNQGIGYVIMCQIFIAFGGGSLIICEEMAVMAAAPHENVASMLALIGLFSSVGQAIGQAISAAIYTNTFPGALNAALPGNATLNAELYGSLTTQLLYPIGSPERTAVIYAYGHA
ncbi:hypothetical protein V8E51_018744 [Hyaloscypha variabilis]